MSRTYCFTPIWNHTGQPAAAVPAGFTGHGLPRSVTLVGRPDDEADAALARRPDRGRAALGGPAPAGHLAWA